MSERPDPSEAEGVLRLSEEDSWDFLRSQEVGRLAVSIAGVPDIFPVNFAVHAGTILFRTAHGTKLAELAVNQYVAFEADRWNAAEGRSVVIRGRARVLDSAAEINEAARLDLRTWAPGPKPVFVRILPDTITGRRLRLSP